MKVKKIIKGIVLVILLAFIVIQFVPVNYNKSEVVPETDISKVLNVPEDIQTNFETSCYDCHSNNTHYPWYNKIQPMSWIMESHIKDGKEELNFSEFGLYSKRRQKSKLKSIVNQIKDDEMPLSSYLILHRKSVLSESDKRNIINWAEQVRDGLK